MFELFGVNWGTPLQFITAVFSGGIFGVLATFYVRNRKITVNAEETLRTHFGEELKRLAESAKESDRRHNECEAAKSELRRELDKMHEEIIGLRAQIRSQAVDRVLLLEERCAQPSPAVADAARRVKNITEGK